MRSAIPLLALSLFVVLLCVPALTRIHQRVDATDTKPSASFGKSVNCPPDKVSGSSLLPAVVVSTAILADVAPRVRHVSPAPNPVRSPHDASPDGLRAPPRA
jgi:hypothetical protein